MEKKFKKWVKEHKKAIVNTALTVAGVVGAGALTYVGVKSICGKQPESSISSAVNNVMSNSAELDIAIPSAGSCEAWKTNSQWNAAILSDVNVSDVGQIGKELQEAFELSDDTKIAMTIDIPNNKN